VQTLGAFGQAQLELLRCELRVGVENVLDSPHVDTLRVNASDGRYYEPG
jgi:hypothetical protein